MIRLPIFPVALAAVVGLAACAGGASGTLDRNPREGQFYSTEEILQLSASARNAYCDEMETYLEELRSETAIYNSRLDSMDVISDTLRTRTIEISSEIREVNSQLRELRLKRKSLESYQTKEGDTLRSVAKLIYGDPLRWEELYEANRAKVPDPNGAISAGTILTLPKGGR